MLAWQCPGGPDILGGTHGNVPPQEVENTPPPPMARLRCHLLKIQVLSTEASMLKKEGPAKAQVLPVTWLIRPRCGSKQAQSQTYGWTEHTTEAQHKGLTREASARGSPMEPSQRLRPHADILHHCLVTWGTI